MRNFRVSDESGHQEAIFSWCDYNRNRYPELELLYHVPNGGKRDAATARALKRQAPQEEQIPGQMNVNDLEGVAANE